MAQWRSRSGVYGRVHDPTREQPYTLFFTSTINLKVWFATAALVLAAVQVMLALRMYGKVHVPRSAPPWLGDAHRLVGTLAFALTLPSRTTASGDSASNRTTLAALAHSILGCFFYGVFTVKVLAVRVHGLPEHLLPIAGGLVFASLAGVWLTSSLWFITSRQAGIPLF